MKEQTWPRQVIRGTIASAGRPTATILDCCDPGLRCWGEEVPREATAHWEGLLNEATGF